MLAGLLIVMAVVLYFSHGGELGSLAVDGAAQVALGVVAGFLIGVVASVMGVAGGELLIPTLVILYGLDVKLAVSMSLAVSLPTMIVAFGRCSRDDSFAILRHHLRFVVLLAVGSAAGAALGGVLVGVVSDGILIPALSVILLVSSVKVWRH